MRRWWRGWRIRHQFFAPRWTQAEVDDIWRRARERAAALAPYID